MRYLKKYNESNFNGDKIRKYITKYFEDNLENAYITYIYQDKYSKDEWGNQLYSCLYYIWFEKNSNYEKIVEDFRNLTNCEIEVSSTVQRRVDDKTKKAPLMFWFNENEIEDWFLEGSNLKLIKINKIMKYLKSYEKFSEKESDLLLDVGLQFFKIIKMHEEKYFNDDKISTDKDYKNNVYEILFKIDTNSEEWTTGEQAIPEELISLTHEKEMEYYDEDKMNLDFELQDVGSSLMEVFFGLEDWTLDKFDKSKCEYFWDFDKSDIYLFCPVDNEEKNSENKQKQLSDSISDLDNTLVDMNKKEKYIGPIEDAIQADLKKMVNMFESPQEVIDYLKEKIVLYQNQAEEKWQKDALDEMLDEYLDALNDSL